MLKLSQITLFFLFPLLAVLMAASAEAEPKRPENVELIERLSAKYFSHYQKVEGFSALSVSMQSKFNPHPVTVLMGTQGVDSTQPVEPISLFQMGSISKSFIAVIILKLANHSQYHLKLDDPLDKFFPEYPAWHHITIRQLLNMTSGIPDYFRYKNILYDYAQHPYQAYSMQSWIDRMYQLPLLYRAGRNFNYSNTNYLLLSLIIEKVTGKPLASVMEEWLIRPLHLNHTFYIPHRLPITLLPYLVRGYQSQRQIGELIPLGSEVSTYSLSYLGGAGAMVSNTDDLLKWVKTLFTPGALLTPDEFKQFTSVVSYRGKKLAKLSADHPLGFGLGIRIYYDKTLRTTVYLYEGITLGYRAIYMYVPQYELALSAAVNSAFDGKRNHLAQLLKQLRDAMILAKK